MMLNIQEYVSLIHGNSTCKFVSIIHIYVSVMCNKGTAYDENTHECKKCDSGNSVDGICVDYAGNVIIFIFIYD